MPTWGLTADQRELKPWGLDPRLLVPCKVTTDPVQGEVYTNWLEQAMIDAPPFQRLRRVRQLGTAHLVYPGATHSRFSHALGTLRVAQDLLDGILNQREGRHAVPDRVAQWYAENEDEAEKRIARVILLTRLGALLHDLGHRPFGHSVEDDLKLLKPHDKDTDRFRDSWKEIGEFVRARAKDQHDETAKATLETLFSNGGDLLKELKPLILSKAKNLKGNPELAFVGDLVGNTICADLLDYLRRDHLFAGLPLSLGTRFTSAFFVAPEGSGQYANHLVLNILRDGRERTDVATELLKALRYRYELSERVLVHHAKLSADAMIGKMLELRSAADRLTKAASLVETLEDREQLLVDRNLGPLWTALANASEGGWKDAERGAAELLSNDLNNHGDDGLLELVAQGPSNAGDTDTEKRIHELRQAAAELAQDCLDRRLFQAAASVGTDSAPALPTYDKWGSAEARARLENGAQRFAGILNQEERSAPAVLIWLPDPGMRLKLAEVLVDDGRHINQFVEYERARKGRGSDIYEAHKSLWRLWVFIDRRVSPKKVEEVLVYLARELGVCWDRFRADFGDRSDEWVERLALSRILGVSPNHKQVGELVRELTDLAARGLDTNETFEDYQEYAGSLPEVKAAKKR